MYVYLVRYAEEQQDVALLSISTFQKALKDPNQLIRGSALRVLSSIRVPIIAPILMLSIKEVFFYCSTPHQWEVMFLHVLSVCHRHVTICSEDSGQRHSKALQVMVLHMLPPPTVPPTAFLPFLLYETHKVLFLFLLPGPSLFSVGGRECCVVNDVDFIF